MAEEAFSLNIIGSKTLRKGQLEKDILEVAEADYKTVLRGIAAQEIAAQQAIGNQPTHIIVDGKNQGLITEANYSVRAFFVDAASMNAALIEAWNDIHANARRVTGRSAQHFQIWIGEGKGLPRYASNSPHGLNSSKFTAATDLYIVGPLLPHVRKYQWLAGTGAGKQATRRSRAKVYKNRPIDKRPMVRNTIHQITAQRMQRKYPWLTIIDAWINVSNENPRGKTPITRVPTVLIFGRNKGALH